ncbi:MAG: UbiD family decarboxylase [Pirellulales bacterium]
MAYKSLADFLDELAQAGEVAHVSAQVDPHLEIAEITRRVAAAGGPALLFDRVRSQSIAVVTNLLGTDARACRALGIESLDAIAWRIETLIEEHTPQNWFDRLKMSPDEAGANKFLPKSVKSGVCQQVVHLGRDVNLATFPLIKSWPGESGPAITGGTLITGDRDALARGASPTPLVALDENRLAVVDDGHSVFSRHWTDHQAAGQRMAAAIVLGGDPAGVVAANLELPALIDAYQAAGLLRGKALEVVKCRTHGLEVPAEADLVFEGYLDPQVPCVTIAAAGAGGSHYRVPRPAPVFHVAAITHRTRPIFPALVDSGLAGEAGVLVKARERMLLPALANVAPDVVDLHLPLLGGLHRFAFVSIRKRYPFHARQIAAALWGTEALKFTKFLILVDHDANVHDANRVWGLVGANVAPERDVFPFDGPGHSSDHANGPAPLGRHLAIDATAKLAGEQPGTWPEMLDVGEETRHQVTSRWAEYKLATQEK